MKKIFLLFMILISTVVLCGCTNNESKPTKYECTYWLVSKANVGMNILETNGKPTYDYYTLVFYKNGDFKLVYKLKENTKEEVYKGTYEDKDNKRYLNYYNKPDEVIFGVPEYSISEDGSVLSRKQSGGSIDSMYIINQSFTLKK